MTTTTGLPVRCQCGHIRMTTPVPEPLSMAHCHCTECRLQSGSAYGTSAYFPIDHLFPLSEDLSSKLSVWTRPTDLGNTMHCYFCPKCGTRIFHVSYTPDGKPRQYVSFKAGMVQGLDWTDVKHIWTKSAVVKLHDEWECYEKVPEGGPQTKSRRNKGDGPGI